MKKTQTSFILILWLKRSLLKLRNETEKEIPKIAKNGYKDNLRHCEFGYFQKSSKIKSLHFKFYQRIIYFIDFLIIYRFFFSSWRFS